MPVPNQIELARRCLASQNDFGTYMEFVHEWMPRAHQRPFVNAVTQLGHGLLTDAEGRPTNKLMFLAPPGAGKSKTCLQATAWLMGRELLREWEPHIGIMAYAEELASRDSQELRQVLDDCERGYGTGLRWGSVFLGPTGPLGQKDKNNWNRESWYLKKNFDREDNYPTVRAAGMGGGMFGFRLTTGLFMDDPSREDAGYSYVPREKVWQTYGDVARTRVAETAFQLLGCTRFAEDDLPGKFIEVGDWHVVWVPALNESEETYWPPEYNKKGQHIPGRGYSTGYLLRLREENPRSFSTQYMALPPRATAQIFRWWTHVEQPPDSEVTQVYQFWDTAETVHKRSTWSVMTEWWKLKSGRVYLADVVRGKWETPALMRIMVEKCAATEKRFGRRIMVKVEGKANGNSIAQLLAGVIFIQAIKGAGRGGPSLEDRARMASRPFESGHVLLPRWAPWLATYKAELEGFGLGAGGWDDQVSSTSLAMECLYPIAMIDRVPIVSYVGGWGRY